MINGSIYLTTDQNMALQFVASNPVNNIVVCISGSEQEYPQFIQATGAMVASILTPPYEACMAEMNGNQDAFCAMYYEHLNRKECMDYIAAILKAITIGKHIMLYLTPDEASLSYSSVFRAFMLQTFGILIGDQSVNFEWYKNMFFNVATTLYLFDLYTYKDLFEVIKGFPTTPLPEVIVMKLIQELKPSLGPLATLQDYANAFMAMAIGHNGTMLEIPARLVN